jgi:hypothetical protein
MSPISSTPTPSCCSLSYLIPLQARPPPIKSCLYTLEIVYHVILSRLEEELWR